MRLFTKSRAPTAEETASFDQIVAASMRIIEVCLLNRPVSEPVGGVAVAGMDGKLDIVVWGEHVNGGKEDTVGNATDALDGTGPCFDPVSQS